MTYTTIFSMSILSHYDAVGNYDRWIKRRRALLYYRHAVFTKPASFPSMSPAASPSLVSAPFTAARQTYRQLSVRPLHPPSRLSPECHLEIKTLTWLSRQTSKRHLRLVSQPQVSVVA